MSNQVYSNGEHKYYGQRGLSNWGLTGGDQAVGATSTVTAAFATQTINQTDPGNWTSAAGVFTCVNEGMYAIQPSLWITRAIPPGANTDIWWLEAGMELLSGFGVADTARVGRIDVLSSPPGAGKGDATTPYTVCPSVTMFIPAGATFRFYVSNFDTVGLVIRAVQSQIIYTKIA